MKKFYSVLLILFISLNSFSQFKNIKLAEQDDKSYPPADPSIAINKRNPKNIVAVTGRNRVIITSDGGQAWTTTEIKSSFGVYGKPAVISNSKGHFFYFHLSDPGGKGRGIVCRNSIDDGATWGEEVSIGNNPPADQDKVWPAVHPKKNEVFVTWTQFDNESSEAGCQSNILFSKSGNGNRFSKPIHVNETSGDCLNDDNTAMGAMTAIGTDGKIYVTWANQEKIYLDRSYDDGNTWLSNDLIVTKQEGGWALNIPGIERCNGLPVLAIDNSMGRYHGTLYLLWADQRNGANDTDIWLMKSRSRGDMWSKPLRINKDEAGSHQFLPWIAVDQTNGSVYIIYYDRRDYDDLQTDVYLAYSFDGGNNFSEVKINETPFTPDASKFFGSHINIDAHADVITPIWTRMDNGQTSTWTSIIKESDLPKSQIKK
ncbi:MAG: exo-alpha-sialidase [Bacteroidetes bacterium]|nr:exo-alpha-sialidase [Bacteroidota bacterium]